LICEGSALAHPRYFGPNEELGWYECGRLRSARLRNVKDKIVSICPFRNELIPPRRIATLRGLGIYSGSAALVALATPRDTIFKINRETLRKEQTTQRRGTDRYAAAGLSFRVSPGWAMPPRSASRRLPRIAPAWCQVSQRARP